MVLINLSVLNYILLSITILLILLYIYSIHAFNYWKRLGVPSQPMSLSKLFKDMTYERKSLSVLTPELYNHHKNQGHKYFGIYMFNLPIFLPIDNELIKNILLKDFDHFFDRGMYYNENDPLSTHLLSLEGMKWKNLRQKLTPTFTSGKLKKMFEILVESTEKLKECLDEKVGRSEPVEVNKVLVQFTTDVIGSCAFGIECNSFKDPDSDFIKYGGKMFRPDFVDMIKQMFAFVFPRFSKRIDLKVINKEVEGFYRGLVRDTVEYREKNGVKRNDFMQLLIQLKNRGNLDEYVGDKEEEVETKLSMDEIAAQAYLFFVAGYETTSSTMTFCMYELAKNLDIQDKTREEIVKVLKKHDGKVCYESIMDMQYLERVILETLRKHTPLPMLPRVVTKEYQVPDSDLVLKKGQLVFVPACGLHEDSDYYPEPEKFDPDRFTEENKASRPDFTFVPFGEGPRICIGMRFAMLEMKICLVQLLLKYKFSLNSKTNDPLVIDPISFIRLIKGSLWLDIEKI